MIVTPGRESSRKRGVAADKGMLEQIRDIFREENQGLVESFENRFKMIEGKHKELEAIIERLEQKDVSAGDTGDTGDFVPNYSKFKGFCEWEDRKTNGATRQDANDLLGISHIVVTGGASV